MTALTDILGSSNNSVPLRVDRATGAIDNPRRRAVLIKLDEADTPMSLSDLAEEIAADENNTHPDKLSSQQRKRVYVSLYQTHLGMLNDLGAIAYDRDEGEIDVTDATAPLAKLIRVVEDRCITIE